MTTMKGLPGLLLMTMFIGLTNGLGEVVLEGDIYIEFIDDVYMDTECTVIDFRSVQNMQAIKWTLSELNDKSFMPSLKIGLRVSKTCNSVETAERLTHQLASEIRANHTTDIVGVLGPGKSSQTEVVSRLLSALPKQYRLLQVGYSATSASLRNRNIYRNYFRTIPPDDVQVEVMRETLIKLNWTIMAVIYDNNTYGLGGINGLRKSTIGMDICFPEEVAINPHTDYNTSYIEDIVRYKIYKIGAHTLEPSISGVIIFGGYQLTNLVLSAIERIRQEDDNRTIPVFLLSEASDFSDMRFLNILRGSYVLSPPRREIVEFNSSLMSMFVDKSQLNQSDTFFKAAYEQYFECHLSDTAANNTCRDINALDVERVVAHSVYNQYAIQSTLVIAYATKVAHSLACGPTFNVICDSFLKTSITPRSKFMDILIGMSINFDKDFGSFRLRAFQEPKDFVLTFGSTTEVEFDQNAFQLYEVYNFQTCPVQTESCRLKKVADYRDDQLYIFPDDIRDYNTDGVERLWPNIRKSQCPDGFASEFCLDHIVDDAVLFIEGDMYIVGIVPVHNIGDTPLQCGSIKHGGVDIAEAIRFVASSEMKSEVFPNIEGRIGVIILDSCNDPQIIQEKVLTLQRRGVFINGAFKPIGNSILGYIGGWSSDVSIIVAQITTRLQTLQISYGSTSTELSRRLTYPYFMRIPSPDDGQAKALLRIAKDLGGNFIQIIYSESKYGEGGRAQLNQYADQDFDICIGNQIPVNIKTKGKDVIKELRKHPGARFVVLFVGSFELENILETLNSDLNHNEFLFIASEGWGTRQTVKGLTKLVGTITLSSQLNIDSRYRKYIKKLQPDGRNINPWIRDYLENYHNCYYQWSFNKTSNKNCMGTEIIGDSNYEIEAWAPFAFRATTLLLMAAQHVLERNCVNTRKLCDNFTVTDLIMELKSQKLEEPNNPSKTHVFNDNGDGTVGYFIYGVNRDGYNYLGYSRYDGDYLLKKEDYYGIRAKYTLSSTCGNEDVCNKCFPVLTSPKKVDSLPTGALVVIILLGIVCCVLAAILFYICNRHGCCIRIENGRPKLTNTYLTPIYMEQRRAQGPIDGREDKELQHQPGDQHYERIPYAKGSEGYRGGDGGSSSGGSYNRKQQTASIQGTPNRAHDRSLDRQNSNVSVQRSISLDPSEGNIGASEISQTSFTSGPVAHKFTKAPPPPGVHSASPLTTEQQHQLQQLQLQEAQYKQQLLKSQWSLQNASPQQVASPDNVIFQTDGSYITASGTYSSSEGKTSGEESVGKSTTEILLANAPKDSKGSQQSLGDTRIISTTQGNQYI